MFNLRQNVNRPWAVMYKRPKDVRFKALPDGSIEVKDFPVPEVSRIEFDGTVLRVLSRSGQVLAKSTPPPLRFNYTAVALKAAGKELASASSSLLHELKENAPGRAQEQIDTTQQQEADALRRQRETKELEERSRREQVEKQKAEQARLERERQAGVHPDDLKEALSRLGVKGSVGRSNQGYNYISMGDVKVTWGYSRGGLRWSVNSLYSGWTLSDGSFGRGGELPRQDSYEKNVLAIAKAVVSGIKDIEAKAQRKKVEEEHGAWSVAWTGYMLADSGEDEDENEVNGSYVMRVETFDSREEAEGYARNNGPAYVVQGTQMWNEPLGQVEEHDRDAKTWFIR